MTDANEQPRNPLHGKTLEAIVTELADYFGWEALWARDKVEHLYLFMLRDMRRAQPRH